MPLAFCCRDNGQLYDTLQLGYVLETYRIVGGVRLRQVRVTNTSCNERRFLSLYDNSSGTRHG
jgi:Polycystin cation channel